MTVNRVLLVASIVVFILTALGVTVGGMSSVEEVATGLALLAASQA